MMIKYTILLLSCVSLQLAFPTDVPVDTVETTAATTAENITECDQISQDIAKCFVSVIQKNLLSASSWEALLMDKNKMIEMISDLENASCIVTSECLTVKAMKYSHDSIIQIGHLVYEHGFDCLQKEYKNIETYWYTCSNSSMSTEFLPIEQLEFNVICAGSKLECSSEEQLVLIEAALKGIDIFKTLGEYGQLQRADGQSPSENEDISTIVTNIAARLK
ncbi:DUF19 domain-containing protein [Caenorhabditis elegans]|uniref:DUF19 domain-containing protein n=1 Tax=Caenorhabditis elegans TaxID=6239 RepID=Q93778_CAEEL|nr:DUF19 domain-containing protein [Caenorhabditis elegans]CAB03134.2 DUF19 domain-containing protein [Caenorhabditis elegans]|eukprot:NP_510608.2 Uncharacterized protein CELE_F53H4.2 [Caenorhabditis elegans]